jgi:carbon monoxide dehydrogenase subunit G
MKNLAEKTILLPVSIAKVYKLLSKIENYARLLKAHTKDWEFDGDTCSFIYDDSTLTKLKMFESIPNQKVVIGTFGNNSVDLDMEFLMFDLGKKGTNFKMVIKADLNPIMASMVSSSMEELRDDFIHDMKEELGVKEAKEQ